MKATNAFFLAGLTAAALGLGAIYVTNAEESKDLATVNAEVKAAPIAVATEDDGSNAAPVVVDGQPSWEELNDYPHFQTVSAFVDVLRATHIAVGQITEVQYPHPRVSVTFQPTTYIKGAPLASSTVMIKTETNADLRALVGQTVTIAFIERTIDGVTDFGACHGIHSITPPQFDVGASIDFYSSMDEIYSRYEGAVDAAVEANADDGRFDFPANFVAESKELLVSTLFQSGTQVAHQAARELFMNPLFSDAMQLGDLARIADAVRASKPGSFDRGYGIKILDKHASKNLSIADALSIVRDETALIIVDHLGLYLSNNHPHGLVVPALAKVFMNESLEETPSMVRNAIVAATLVGDRLALPYMDKILGKLSDRASQRALLDAYRHMHSPRNLEPLVIYMNGGVPSEMTGTVARVGEGEGQAIERKQSDALDSRELMKRTILAISMIDSKESNMLLRQMHATAREEWLQNFISMVKEQNKGWRAWHEILEEGDVSARAIALK